MGNNGGGGHATFYILLAFIQEKDVVIREQAEEIGQLRERITQMQQRFEKDAANANTDTIANVGWFDTQAHRSHLYYQHP